MTRPVFEPNFRRKISGETYRARQLLRRPSPEAFMAQAEWIRIQRDVAVTLTNNTDINPFIADSDTFWEESSNLSGAMEVGTRTIDAASKYAINILEPGAYTFRFDVVISDLDASPNTRCRPLIQSNIIGLGLAGQSFLRFEYTEANSSFSVISATDSIIVIQPDINDSTPTLNYCFPRIRQESGISKTAELANFHVWRIPCGGPVS